jgi:hypothetical protein
MGVSMLKGADPRTSLAARWTSTGRFAAAGALVLGPGLELASILIERERTARSTRSSGSPTTRIART